MYQTCSKTKTNVLVYPEETGVIKPTKNFRRPQPYVHTDDGKYTNLHEPISAQKHSPLCPVSSSLNIYQYLFEVRVSILISTYRLLAKSTSSLKVISCNGSNVPLTLIQRTQHVHRTCRVLLQVTWALLISIKLKIHYWKCYKIQLGLPVFQLNLLNLNNALRVQHNVCKK